MNPLTLGMLAGLTVHSDQYMRDWKQVRFPRSKKRRIRKKWTKQRKNFGWVPSPTIYRMGNMIIAHPKTINAFIRKYNNGQSAIRPRA
jgi:hypothetical protein